ncbi:MAG: nucleotidyltransferase [Dethiosulfatibacter sp.]|nr:nucleotidyltransferase [Dethiosulfatibacter sp.]
MKNIAIIAEFNPFHNGHQYLIDEIKTRYKPDNIIVVMSGNFVQRGDLAIIDKWRRAEAAIHCGANLVLELPVPYAFQNAQVFAEGALAIISRLSIDHICFGTESDDIEDLVKIANLLTNESTDFKLSLQTALKQGVSFPKALSMTLDNEDLSELLSPNNILAIEYIKTINKKEYSITACHIKRKGSPYNSELIIDKLSSATAIRKALFKGLNDDVKSNVPIASHKLLCAFYNENNGFNTMDHLFDMLKYKIISSDPLSLSNIYGMAEGLENRILKSIEGAENLETFIMNIKSKRYTYLRIRRILLNILLNLTKDTYDSLSVDDITFARVLATDYNGRSFIRANSNKLNFLTRKSDFDSLNATATDIAINNLTEYSTKIYYLKINSHLINNENKKNPFVKKDG